MTPRRRQHAPRRRRLEIYHRLRGRSQRIVECALYATEGGLELRFGYDADQPIETARVLDRTAARALAARWKQAILDKGSFEDLPVQGPVQTSAQRPDEDEQP